MVRWTDFISKYLVGQSPCFLREIDKIPIIAKCESSVLVHGETGTGKEVCVRVIHHITPRSSKSYVAVNCGAIPHELAENELFGHKHGAFTGASQGKPGLIQEAEGGILFLDEVDNLPQMVQVKLLRFLQEKTYRPLGSTKELKADVRVLAAMNVDPMESVKLGRLRKDLYYRLNVISINLPPLRARREDIPLLAKHFLRKHSQAHSKVLSLSPYSLQKLMAYDWPGNVRELEHVIERAVIFANGERIEDLPHLETGADNGIEPLREAKRRVIESFEKQYIRNLLTVYGGNISKAALAAQKHRRAFLQLIKKHQIEVEKFKKMKVIA